MNNKEFKKLISHAKELDWFNSIDEKINYDHLELSLTFTKVTALHEYVSNQVIGWQNMESVPAEIAASKGNYELLLGQIEHFGTQHINESSNELNRNWSYIVKQHILNIGAKNTFPFDCPETEFLISLNRVSPNYVRAAFEFMAGGVNNIANRNNLTGAILAYEFISKGKSLLTTRRKAEDVSLNKLKGEFTDYLSRSEQLMTEFLADSTKKYNEYTEGLDLFKTTKETEVIDWIQTSKSDLDLFDKDAKKKIADLEEAYDEKLRLSKPADYWNRRAEKLKKEGWMALYWLVSVVLLGCITLYFLLWQTPDGMLKSFFDDDKSIALKWSIIYITFISFLVIGIRAISKVMFSSFHLSRDAEEREHLTYVYLALIKESAVDVNDKHLIMQSLFSRADTGLLKDDSSPAMPGNIADRMFQK